MTASKRTVRTRRGVEPAGRPARREVERGRGARTNSSIAQELDGTRLREQSRESRRWRRTPVGDLVRRQERRPREAQRQASLDAAGGLDLFRSRGQLRALVQADQGSGHALRRGNACRGLDGREDASVLIRRLVRPKLSQDPSRPSS